MVTFFHDTEQDFGIEVDPRGCRHVVTELLRIESRYGVSATYNVVGEIYRRQPDLIAEIIRSGGEVAFHSFHHTYEPENYTSEVALCRQLSPVVRGYRSPRGQWNEATLNALWRNGFSWNSESDDAREPYFVHKGLVRVPIAGDDWDVHLGTMNEQDWIASFASLMDRRRCFGFGNHDSVISLKPEERVHAYERVIQVALQKKALIVNFSEAADLFRRAFRERTGQLPVVNEKQIEGADQREDSDRSPINMKSIPLSEFDFEFRNWRLDAFVKSFAGFMPSPARKALKKLPYFRGL